MYNLKPHIDTIKKFNVSISGSLDLPLSLHDEYRITKGNHFEIKGNHDSAGYGLTEREFYIEKGLLKEPINMTIGNVNIVFQFRTLFENQFCHFICCSNRRCRFNHVQISFLQERNNHLSCRFHV